MSHVSLLLASVMRLNCPMTPNGFWEMCRMNRSAVDRELVSPSSRCKRMVPVAEKNYE